MSVTFPLYSCVPPLKPTSICFNGIQSPGASATPPQNRLQKLSWSQQTLITLGPKSERLLRWLQSRLYYYSQKQQIEKLLEEGKEVQTHPERFVPFLLKVLRHFSPNAVFSINTESGILDRLVASGENAIFVLNHNPETQQADSQMLGALGKVI